MYEIFLKNIDTNKQFSVYLESPYLLKQFLKKVKYSKKVKLLFYKNLYQQGSDIMNYIKILAYVIWFMFFVAYIWVIYSIWKGSKKR